MTRGCIHRNVSLAILACATVITGPASADSMRCGKWIVNETATKDELLKKCGEPQSRDVTQEDVVAQNPSGARIKTGGVKVTERWIYQLSSGSLPMAVVIVDDRIVSLQRAE